MLKIKDNVDLKELEKFGLKPHEKYPEIYVYRSKNSCLEIDRDSIWFSLYTEDISKVDHYEGIYFSMINAEIATILFDLIQAGLVENV